MPALLPLAVAPNSEVNEINGNDTTALRQSESFPDKPLIKEANDNTINSNTEEPAVILKQAIEDDAKIRNNESLESMAVACCSNSLAPPSPVRADSVVDILSAFEEDAVENVSPDPPENSWVSWTPKTRDYWAMQYSGTDIENNFEERDTQVCLLEPNRGTHLDLGLLKKDLPPDGDHSSIQKSLPPSGQGNSEERRPQRPTQRFLYYGPFVNCNAEPHFVGIHFQSPKFLSRFFGKVFFVKAVQMIFVTLLVLAYPYCLPQLDFIQSQPSASGYICLLIFMVGYCGIRCLPFGRDNSGGILALFICTICSAVICIAIYYNGEPHVVLAVLLILFLTYSTLAIAAYFGEIDVSEKGNIYWISCGLVLLNTAISLLVVMAVSAPVLGLDDSYAQGVRFSAICAPAVMSTLTLVLFQLSELHQIMGGYRLPLNEDDFVVAAAFLI